MLSRSQNPDVTGGLMFTEGGLMNDFTGRVKRDEWHPPNGFRRTVTVAMDTAQYQMDITHMQATKGEDLYGTFNMVMRRKPKVHCLIPPRVYHLCLWIWLLTSLC